MYYTRAQSGEFTQVSNENVLLNFSDEEILNKAESIQRAWIKQRREPITSSSDAEKLIRSMFRYPDREQFLLIILGSDNRFLEGVVLATGTINKATIHIRELIKSMLKHQGVSAIVAHNHPSGKSYPSGDDIAITASIQKAFKLMDMKLLDHLIIGEQMFSFKKENYL